MFAQALTHMLDESNTAWKERVHPDDYEKNGVLHCYKCHTPKEMLLRMPDVLGGGIKKQGHMCQCETERYATEEAVWQRAQEMQAVDRLRSASLMDTRFYGSTFASYRETEHNRRALKLCRRYADAFNEMEQKNQGLVFFGDVGTGKTYSAACIVNALLERRVSVLMTSFVALLRIAYEGGDGWRETLAGIRRARLLVIDDLGAERNTDTALEHVYGVVDDRYRSGKPVIFTTNQTLGQLQNPPDMRFQRIYDRVLETCYPVEFTGPSMRVEEAAERYEAMRDFLEGSI